MNYPGTLPTSADLREGIDAVENQGSLGSCTAFAATNDLEIIYERAGYNVEFSQLYQYYRERQMENTLPNEGAYPSYAFLSLEQNGCCLESSWPYIAANENINPPSNCDIEAANYKISGYEWPTISDGPLRVWFKNHIACGTPVCISFDVAQNFVDQAGACKDWRTTPWTPGGTLLGGHEVCCIGYDDACQMFLFQNSWGPTWGDGGFFGLSYANVEALPTSIMAITGCNVPLLFVPNAAMNIVNTMYEQALQRPADQEGVAYWSQQTQYSSMTGICSSAEFFQKNTTIFSLYPAMLGRQPDSVGLSYWTATGGTIPQIELAFAGSSEFQTRYPNA